MGITFALIFEYNNDHHFIYSCTSVGELKFGENIEITIWRQGLLSNVPLINK
tara:strand:+ start:118 stop:273 length:156 start_codon:yes stop_codon:yes gene_type:complete